MINALKIKILSTLLHHANRECSTVAFYRIKNDLLDKYGRSCGYDVQHIPGKKCHSCGGTGIYTGYYWSSGEQWHDTCNRCFGGWYKSPQWNTLAKIKFGRFVFHSPRERFYSEERALEWIAERSGGTNQFGLITKQNGIIEGYVSHNRAKYGEEAALLLFLIYDRKNIPFGFGYGLGWRSRWYLPQAWMNNILHLFNYRMRAIPIIDMREKLHKIFGKKEKEDLSIFTGKITDEDSIPF